MRSEHYPESPVASSLIRMHCKAIVFGVWRMAVFGLLECGAYIGHLRVCALREGMVGSRASLEGRMYGCETPTKRNSMAPGMW